MALREIKQKKIPQGRGGRHPLPAKGDGKTRKERGKITIFKQNTCKKSDIKKMLYNSQFGSTLAVFVLGPTCFRVRLILCLHALLPHALAKFE